MGTGTAYLNVALIESNTYLKIVTKRPMPNAAIITAATWMPSPTVSMAGNMRSMQMEIRKAYQRINFDTMRCHSAVPLLHQPCRSIGKD